MRRCKILFVFTRRGANRFCLSRTPNEFLFLCLALAWALIVHSVSLAQDNASPDRSAKSSQDDPDSDDEVELVARVRKSLVTFRVDDRDGKRSRIGSGFVLDSAGLIATNYHVIHQGREFSVELWPNRTLKVTGVEAANRDLDLAIVRVAVDDQPLPPLPLATIPIQQGATVFAFGNPFGLQHSVVRGIVSALREMEGREMIQLAIPVQPGNSGGPLVDPSGRVHGIVNMKSAVDDNLGFAIPVQQVRKLLDHPNPIGIDQWIRMNTIDPLRWKSLFGARWLERSSVIQVSGMGDGFGGRALCLWTAKPENESYQLSVQVKLDDEAGAAGLVFACDDTDKHYGFYPSNGNLRLSCFRGPDVLSWQVLEDAPSVHYRVGEWNRLMVRFQPGMIRCFVNDQLVIESRDRTFTSGQVGLAKFRDTTAQFKSFRIGAVQEENALDPVNQDWLKELASSESAEWKALPESLSVDQAETLADKLKEQSVALRKRSEEMQQMAADVRLIPILEHLKGLNRESSKGLLEAALWIASLENPDLQIDRYLAKVDSMAAEVSAPLKEGADEAAKLQRLNEYLFEQNGYRGGAEEFYHLANSLIDRVIDDREGMPITLCVLYIELGRRLHLEFEGVGLPGHFVVAWKHPGDSKLNDRWIDVFDQGKPLNFQDLSRQVLASSGRPIEETDLAAQSTWAFSRRILNNMLGSAQRAGNTEAMLRCAEALVALDPNQTQARLMRAALRRQTGRITRSNEDLDWLIEKQPPGIDVHDLIRLRNQPFMNRR